MEVRSIGRRISKLERARSGELGAMSEEDRRRDAEAKAAVDRVEALIREGRKPDGEDLAMTLAWITLAGTWQDQAQVCQLMGRYREAEPGSDERGRIEKEIVQFASEAVERAP